MKPTSHIFCYCCYKRIPREEIKEHLESSTHKYKYLLNKMIENSQVVLTQSNPTTTPLI